MPGGIRMAQLYDQFGAFLEHAAGIGGHLLGQKPERSALGFVAWGAVGSARQFGGDQDVIDPSHRGIGTGGAGHCSLRERSTTTLGPPGGSGAENNTIRRSAQGQNQTFRPDRRPSYL